MYIILVISLLLGLSTGQLNKGAMTGHKQIMKESEEEAPKNRHIKAGKKRPTMIDVLSGKLNPIFFSGKWISDVELVIDKSIRNIETGVTEPILKSKELTREALEIVLSKDRKYALVKDEKEAVFRQSEVAHYTLVSLQDSNSEMEFPQKDQYIRMVDWSPVGNSLVYVSMDNNIYYRAKAAGEDIQLTTRGKPGSIYCGTADWVYEEEVLEHPSAVWWAPDARALAYMIFDDRRVTSIQLPYYGAWQSAPLYPGINEIKYPKVGTTNPNVELWVAIFSGKKPIQKRLQAPTELDEPILSRVIWLTKTALLANWLNRIQNVSVTVICWIEPEYRCKEVIRRSQEDGWFEKEMHFTPYTGPQKNLEESFLMVAPDDTEDQFVQIFMWDSGKTKNKLTQLTKRKGDVISIEHFSDNLDVYFLATTEGDRTEKHLYRISASGKGGTTCLTCREKFDCNYVDVSMSEKGSYYILHCKGPKIPYSLLVNTESNVGVKILEENQKLSENLKAFVPWKRSHIKVGQHNVELTLPPGVSMVSKKKHPAFVYVYGGPGSQMVTKEWADASYITRYMAMAHNVIGIKMDVSGSGKQGFTYQSSVYRSIGLKETEDILSIVEQLQDRFEFIDSDKTGIFGWSYGGFLSLSVLASDKKDVFHAGVSVAPVAKWEMYDSIYTERYMSTLTDNPDGYNKTSPLWKVEGIRNKKFFLLHGTFDDNVHFQHSMFIAEALEEKNIMFKQLTYPDQNHSILKYILHVYLNLEEFFVNTLGTL